METTFSIFETVAEVKFSFVLNVDFSGTEVMSFPEFSFFFEADACVNWTDRSLSSFSEKKKCNFKSMSRFAVVEFEEIDATFLVEYGWIIKTSWKISSFCYRGVWWRNSSCLRRKISKRCWRHRNRKCWRFICASRRFYKLLHWRDHSGAFQ